MNPRSWRLRRPRLGTVLGGLALFIALQGTAFALPGLNTVDSGDIINNQVKSSDLGLIAKVTGAPLVIAAGLTGTAVANCPAGSQVMGVGFQRSGPDLSVGNTDTLGVSQARVTAYNASVLPLVLSARAFCLQP